jgi:hypothetical protein
MAKVDAKHKGPSFWERLQPRERVLVMALVGVAFLMFTMVLMFMRYKKLTAIDEEIADMRDALDLTRTFGPSYKDKLSSKEQKDDKMSTEPLLFSTLIEQAAETAEVKVSNQTEKPPVEVAPGMQKRTYEFDLRSVTLAQLTKFLSAVESKEGHVVQTHALTIRSPSGAEDRLNVDVILATYEQIGAPAGDEVPEEPEGG